MARLSIECDGRAVLFFWERKALLMLGSAIGPTA